MTQPDAYTFVRDFEPAAPQVLKMDRHYLLYATAGAMRLEANGMSWSLPPARGALLRAGHPITVILPQRMTACSVLFAPEFVPEPPVALAVFDMTPLARELVLACRAWGPDAVSLDDHASLVFRTLASVTWKLAETPGRVSMPTGRSRTIARALALTEASLDGTPRFEDIAADLAMTPRSLARRFETELGMTWRQALRRMRMIRAVEALASGDCPVTEIAFGVGYASLSAFNAAFREFTGQTPSEYRGSFRP